MEMDIWDAWSKKKKKKKKTIYICIKKDEKKKTYLAPKWHVLTHHSGPRNDGGEVGEVWEMGQRHHVLVASQNWAKKTKAWKY